ncbi:CcdC family protein [Pseudalkalibacillus hwajinpoensis]|uniref:Cytochrome c biogenesis protein CcdC n=1 Tax=Guptibacillus hwajinpoensis TaxID=208199 RepID=A0A4U1MMS8_9BACL|nr:cytochrome c biogenesis protein CcdC [Pseudalkalibacillus hwajinpoensis]TKD72603.1 cytochrome c biogenesis protein CcdC [Pseudalkalibacillus hwajinpoensis]
MLIFSTIVGALMAMAMVVIRLKASKKPATIRKIILPPFFMATGFFMFAVPEARVPWYEAIEALSVGAAFSLLLIRTSKFEIKGDQIYLTRSKAFAFILVGLLLVRIIFKLIIGESIPVLQTSSLFFVLAFGMIVPWRIAMYFQFRKTERSRGHRTNLHQTLS